MECWIIHTLNQNDENSGFQNTLKMKRQVLIFKCFHNAFKFRQKDANGDAKIKI